MAETQRSARVKRENVAKRRRPRVALMLVLVTTMVLWVFAVGNWPGDGVLITEGDSPEYLAEAVSLVHGQDPVHVEGLSLPSRFTPGFPLLLAPFVAIGGVNAAVWVPFLSALMLGGMAATLVWLLAGPFAAVPTVFTVLFNPVVALYTRWIMSDVPAATLLVLEVILLLAAPQPAALIVAGSLAGALIWIRPAMSVLLIAGVLGLTAAQAWRRSAAAYLVGALPFLVLLLGWQWATFGFPLTTTYQAAGASPSGDSALTGFFGLRYIVGPPWNTAAEGTTPNVLVYPSLLLGFDDRLLPAGLGLIGLLSTAVLAPRSGRTGIFGRVVLTTAVLTLIVYVPYFYRAPRFLLGASSLLGIAAWAGLTTVATGMWPSLRTRFRPN